MPREFRKRGKKTKKSSDKDPKDEQVPHAEPEDEPHAGPSWIIPASNNSEEINLEAPFGFLDVDVKAYFRTVDIQIRSWQDNGTEAREGDTDVDPNEERRLFFIAALAEMSNKEKQLATDPDCSNILERMIYSMDDFARRVFIDRLAGSYEALVRHRFASHVCQTLFTVSADTIAREEKGILPPTSNSSDEGELRTLTELVVAICKELGPSFTSLIMDPFASHVLRALLLLLCPSLSSSDNALSKSYSAVRSRKSAAWKARQAPMKNVFAEKGTDDDLHTPIVKSIPKQFHRASANFLRILREELGENEVRALAADKVASPVLQIMLEIEADQGTSNAPGSIMDHVLVGIITSYDKDPAVIPEQSDYLSTFFRDPTSSHLLETVVTRAPDRAFVILWSTYFQGKLARLSAHPVANFVVARAMERVNASQLESACEELRESWGKIIKSSRTGVLRAMIDKAATLGSHEKKIVEGMCAAFNLMTDEDRNLFVPCVMILKPLQDYRSVVSAQSQTHDGQVNETYINKGHRNTKDDPLEPKVQGAIILQSLLRMNEPHNLVVIDSIKSLPSEDLLRLAYHPTSSRVLDVILESSTVSFKAKRNFVMSLIGHYHVLVDDRIGSRVADRCWAFADPYLREKIARSLFAFEQYLTASFYGKFFARNLNLHLLQRKPDDWRNLQSQYKLASSQAIKPIPTEASYVTAVPLAPPIDKPQKRKRNTTDNEIDALFHASLGRKIKKGVLEAEPKASSAVDGFQDGHTTASLPVDGRGLVDVLEAIRVAPKDEKGGKRKKKRVR